MAEIEMEIDSVRVSHISPNCMILLKERDSERYLPIWMSAPEADAIQFRRHHLLAPRPLTHDLLITILNSFGATVTRVVVQDLQHDTFFAALHVATNDDVRAYDCRVSDALAVAVTAKAPIFATDSVLNAAGVILDDEEHKHQPVSFPTATSPSSARHSTIAAVFSNGAQRALNEAEQIAKQATRNSVDTIDLLTALIRQTDTRAAIILARLGFDETHLHRVRETYPKEPDSAGATTNVKSAIQLAIGEARSHHSDKVRTEHLLLGLIQETQGLASKTLAPSAVTAQAILQQLRNIAPPLSPTNDNLP